MPLWDVFASNALVRLLRGNPGRYDLLTRMIGARLGDRMLACGAGDPGLVAALSKVMGLSGRAVAYAGSPDDASRIQAAADGAGVLVEVVECPPTALPFTEGDFDIALVDAVSAPVVTLLPRSAVLRLAAESSSWFARRHRGRQRRPRCRPLRPSTSRGPGCSSSATATASSKR